MAKDLKPLQMLKENKQTTVNRPTITSFDLSGSGSALLAKWSFSQSANIEKYTVVWYYSTGTSGYLIDVQEDTTTMSSTYECSKEGAISVKFKVYPVSKTNSNGTKKVPNCSWSTEEIWYLKHNPPEKPSKVPEVSIDDLTKKLTTNVEISQESTATHVQFQIVNPSNGTIIKSGEAVVSDFLTRPNSSAGTETFRGAEFTHTLKDMGLDYVVRCRAICREDKTAKLMSTSEWTGYSAVADTAPDWESGGITQLYALTADSVGINWTNLKKAKSYEIQYTTNTRYFDTNQNVTSESIDVSTDGSDQKNIVGQSVICGLASGHEYFFRVRAKTSSTKYSSWCAIKSIALGTKPAPPTTWSSASSVKMGDDLNLYWVHNSTDESRQPEEILELTINGETQQLIQFNYAACATGSSVLQKIVEIHGLTGVESDEVEERFYIDGTTIKVVMSFLNISESPTLCIKCGEDSDGHTITTDPRPIIGTEYGGTYWSANDLVTFTYSSANSSWQITNVEASAGATSVYNINTISYDADTTIKWRVKTAGVLKNADGSYVYSDWSIERTVKIFKPPSVVLSVKQDAGANEVAEGGSVVRLPFFIEALLGSSTQIPLSYYFNIVSNQSYYTEDDLGNDVYVSENHVVYSKHIDTSARDYSFEISAGDVNLENNMSYTINCSVAMDSGLSAVSSSSFKVAWENPEYTVDAVVTYDEETFTTTLTPYCVNLESGEYDTTSWLSVYRREFDGRFVKIVDDVHSFSTVVDPHPALDYARYRIVARQPLTGAVTFTDLYGLEIGEKAVIIQWDEPWNNFDIQGDGLVEEPEWSGSLLRLPYNIDVKESNTPDCVLVSYIGRQHPVSYYGTHLGTKATWNVEIPKSDKETLYALRRLQAWLGDVYVREPSGSGYWANITVAFEQKHRELTIPVTMEITRVEGGA